jgi:hypothetical protein
MGNTILENVPGRPATGHDEAEQSTLNAQAEIQKRLDALKSGEKTPEDFMKQHRDTTAENSRAAAYPTMVVDLPSKGLIYPEDNPLSLGTVEMKFMTAKEEDILTTESYIKKGIVLDKLFQSLIVSKIDYESMLIGDRDAIMIAARSYGYGDEYDTKVTTPSGNTQVVRINLNEIPHKEIDESMFSRENKFFFTTTSGTVIEFKLLTNGDQREIQENLTKVKRGDSRDTQLTTRLYQMIQAIDGNRDRKFIKAYIENDLRAIDSRNFREYVAKIQPGMDMSIDIVDEATGEPFRTNIAIGLDFFWPNV